MLSSIYTLYSICVLFLCFPCPKIPQKNHHEFVFSSSQLTQKPPIWTFFILFCSTHFLTIKKYNTIFTSQTHLQLMSNVTKPIYIILDFCCGNNCISERSQLGLCGTLLWHNQALVGLSPTWVGEGLSRGIHRHGMQDDRLAPNSTLQPHGPSPLQQATNGQRIWGLVSRAQGIAASCKLTKSCSNQNCVARSSTQYCQVLGTLSWRNNDWLPPTWKMSTKLSS